MSDEMQDTQDTDESPPAPPSTFGLSPAQREAMRIRREQLAAEATARAEREKAELHGVLGGILARAQQAQAALQKLPCAPGVAEGNLFAAVRACGAQEAFYGCAWNDMPDCARIRVSAMLKPSLERMESARVPGAEDLLKRFQDGKRCMPLGDDPSFAERLFADLPGHVGSRGATVPSVPLMETDAVRLVRAWLRRRALSVPMSGDKKVLFTGTEWLLLFGGSRGPGKTLAGCLALRETGGLFVTAAELCKLKPPVDLDLVERTKLLVIDDLGTEQMGETRFAAQRINEVMSARHAARRMTLVTTNLLRRKKNPRDESEDEGLAERYGSRLDDRMNEGGRLVALTGPSLRGSR